MGLTATPRYSLSRPQWAHPVAIRGLKTRLQKPGRPAGCLASANTPRPGSKRQPPGLPPTRVAERGRVQELGSCSEAHGIPQLPGGAQHQVTAIMSTATPNATSPVDRLLTTRHLQPRASYHPPERTLSTGRSDQDAEREQGARNAGIVIAHLNSTDVHHGAATGPPSPGRRTRVPCGGRSSPTRQCTRDDCCAGDRAAGYGPSLWALPSSAVGGARRAMCLAAQPAQDWIYDCTWGCWRLRRGLRGRGSG